jgi:hypothetical protein
VVTSRRPSCRCVEVPDLVLSQYAAQCQAVRHLHRTFEIAALRLRWKYVEVELVAFRVRHAAPLESF